jgi:hypothetical protein
VPDFKEFLLGNPLVPEKRLPYSVNWVAGFHGFCGLKAGQAFDRSQVEKFLKEVVALAEWIRRRVRLYYWKQWKRPRTRRRHLLALGIPKDEVRMATRSRKGYWRMSHNGLVQRALNNDWLHAQGVPDMRTSWIVLHYGQKARV